jgi:hypothetical protein
LKKPAQRKTYRVLADRRLSMKKQYLVGKEMGDSDAIDKFLSNMGHNVMSATMAGRVTEYEETQFSKHMKVMKILMYLIGFQQMRIPYLKIWKMRMFTSTGMSDRRRRQVGGMRNVLPANPDSTADPIQLNGMDVTSIYTRKYHV